MLQPPDISSPEAQAIAGAASLGGIGGVVRAMRTPQCSPKKMVVEFVTSVFAAMLLGFFLWDTNIPFFTFMGVGGAAGYVAPRILDLLGKKACRLIGDEQIDCGGKGE